MHNFRLSNYQAFLLGMGLSVDLSGSWGWVESHSASTVQALATDFERVGGSLHIAVDREIKGLPDAEQKRLVQLELIPA